MFDYPTILALLIHLTCLPSISRECPTTLWVYFLFFANAIILIQSAQVLIQTFLYLSSLFRQHFVNYYMKKIISSILNKGKKVLGHFISRAKKSNFLRKIGRSLLQSAVDGATSVLQKKLPTQYGQMISNNKDSLKKMAYGKYNQLYNKYLDPKKEKISVTDSYEQK